MRRFLIIRASKQVAFSFGVLFLFFWMAYDRYPERMDTARYSAAESTEITNQLAQHKNPDWLYSMFGVAGCIFCCAGGLLRLLERRD